MKYLLLLIPIFTMSQTNKAMATKDVSGVIIFTNSEGERVVPSYFCKENFCSPTIQMTKEEFQDAKLLFKPSAIVESFTKYKPGYKYINNNGELTVLLRWEKNRWKCISLKEYGFELEYWTDDQWIDKGTEIKL